MKSNGSPNIIGANINWLSKGDRSIIDGEHLSDIEYRLLTFEQKQFQYIALALIRQWIRITKKNFIGGKHVILNQRQYAQI